MARKGISTAPEPTPERLARDSERARLAALIDAEPGDEVPAEVVEAAPEVIPVSGDTPQEASGDDTDVEEPPPGSTEPTSDAKKSQVWEAIKAQKEALRDYGQRHADSLAAIERLTARLETLTPQPEASVPDPEVAAWNEAVEETISPHLAAVRLEQWKTNLALSQMRAAQSRPDYWNLVNLDDESNALARHLAQFPDVARQIGQAKDIGVALYDYALELRERDPTAREAWVTAERTRIYNEERAKLLAEFKGVVAKGGKAPPAPTSIVSAPNSGHAAPNAPLTKAQIRAMDRRQLNELVARGEAGEDIH